LGDVDVVGDGAVAQANAPFAAGGDLGLWDARTIVMLCWSRSLASRLRMPGGVRGVQVAGGLVGK